eukprot:gnl/Trimastix_PCT/1130.p1 GENE.gnl/Trimastix_PCT/1130~~gnl/Trimastix_PCT/1130.p1  ORF type:complete len:450 (+),score=100.16 gnl/Trimastix_PCT/1130:949-2298(+)
MAPTTAAGEARMLIPHVYRIMLAEIPPAPAVGETPPNINFSCVESLLYAFHILGAKTPRFLAAHCGMHISGAVSAESTEEAAEIAFDVFRERLDYLDRCCVAFQSHLEKRHADAASRPRQVSMALATIANNRYLSKLLLQDPPALVRPSAVGLSWRTKADKPAAKPDVPAKAPAAAAPKAAAPTATSARPAIQPPGPKPTQAQESAAPAQLPAAVTGTHKIVSLSSVRATAARTQPEPAKASKAAVRTVKTTSAAATTARTVVKTAPTAAATVRTVVKPGATTTTEGGAKRGAAKELEGRPKAPRQAYVPPSGRQGAQQHPALPTPALPKPVQRTITRQPATPAAAPAAAEPKKKKRARMEPYVPPSLRQGNSSGSPTGGAGGARRVTRAGVAPQSIPNAAAQRMGQRRVTVTPTVPMTVTTVTPRKRGQQQQQGPGTRRVFRQSVIQF